MNLVKLFIPIGRKYVIKYKDAPEIVEQKLVNIEAGKKTEGHNGAEGTSETAKQVATALAVASTMPKPLSETIKYYPARIEFTSKPQLASQDRTDNTLDNNGILEFNVRPRRLFSFALPSLHGRLDKKSSQIELTCQFDKLTARLINVPINLGLGAIFGTLASACLAPDVAPLVSLIITTAFVPMMLAVFVLLALKALALPELKSLTDTVVESIGLSPDNIPQSADVDWMRAVFSEQTIATIVAAALTLGAASYLHNYAWDLWCHGKYEQSEALCRPVQTLAKAIVGANSPVAADCEYYTAECLRCQKRYREAQLHYIQAKELLVQKLGEINGMVADSTFNLARAYEGDGNLKQARDNYEACVKLYENVKTVGPNGAWLARVLDRQAMCLLKSGEPEKALQAEKRACAIDRGYSSSSQYRNYGQVLNDLGVIYFRLGHLNEAEQTFSEALTQKGFADTELAQATTQYNLGQVFKALNKLDRGESFFQTARTIWRRHAPDAAKYKEDGRLYQAVLDANRQLYEVPNWDTRAEEIVTGVGRI